MLLFTAIYRPGLRSRNRSKMRNIAATAAEKRRSGANFECRGRGWRMRAVTSIPGAEEMIPGPVFILQNAIIWGSMN